MEIPKRKFALEEKDLAIEADENNKVAEEKENRFLNKLQKDATDNIEHLPTEKVLERLPDPTGWRILVLPYKGQGKTNKRQPVGSGKRSNTLSVGKCFILLVASS